MKTRILFLIVICVIVSALSNAQNKNTVSQNQKIELKTAADTAAYAIGVNVANSFQRQHLDTLLKVDFIVAGLRDQYANVAKIAVEDAESFLQSFFQDLQATIVQGKIDEGKKFFEENGKRKEVSTTATGLQYEVVKMGTGAKPEATNTVSVHYKGTLIDGTKFDSSYDRGKPAEFPLNRVISGWTEGLQLMPVGSTFKFYIPYNLGYGENGQGGIIGPYETLIFDVELLDILK